MFLEFLPGKTRQISELCSVTHLLRRECWGCVCCYGDQQLRAGWDGDMDGGIGEGHVSVISPQMDSLVYF